MALSIQSKLKIKPGQVILTLGAPANFESTLGKLPAGTSLVSASKKPDQIYWFVKDKKQLDKDLKKVLKLLAPGVIAWICFPKGSSGIQTDLTRDKGWDKLEELSSELLRITLISIDDMWSAFGYRKNQ